MVTLVLTGEGVLGTQPKNKKCIRAWAHMNNFCTNRRLFKCVTIKKQTKTTTTTDGSKIAQESSKIPVRKNIKPLNLPLFIKHGKCQLRIIRNPVILP